MKTLFKNKKRIKKIILISLVMIFVLGVIGWAQAQTGSSAAVTIPNDGSPDMYEFMVKLLSWIVLPLVSVAGKLLLLLVEILVPLASYNDFIDSRAVAIGWVVVRDLSNLFFVIVMLVIAFGTLFNIQTYEYKKLLPKLIIAAIL